MKQNNFYLLLGSRLGLKNYPIGSNEHNIGVEDGAQTIFNQLIKDKKYYQKIFTKPEEIKQNFFDLLFSEYDQAIDEVKKRWPERARLVTLGGDHSISYISINSVLDRYGNENTGVIFFDSHADLHLQETSPTGNFHGMWMRTFFDQFTQSSIPCKKLRGEQLFYIGNLQTESEEDQFISQHQIINISQKNLNDSVQILSNFVRKFDHLHITFDIDVFKSKLVKATGTPNPNGLEENDVFRLFDLLLKSKSLSIDIVEYNLNLDADGKTLKMIKKIIDRLN